MLLTGLGRAARIASGQEWRNESMTEKVLRAALARAGPYEVVARIGDGGMATVYKGVNPSTGAVVAIKVLSPESAANPVVIERFKQEYRAARTLRHPHLVQGLDFGEEGSVPYMVMEYVDGEDLATRIERLGKLPEAEAVRLITQVAEAVQQAHDNQIIHRDIKPSNILVSRDGVAKLTDLGLVKDYGSTLDLTRPLVGMGTPHFMAPEQFGDAKHADARCDVYSLGATLYTAVTGELPFRARSNLHILKKKLKNDLPAPRQVNPRLSLHVDLAIRRALRAEATERQPSCKEFIASLAGPALPFPARPEPRNGAPARPAAGVERRATVRFPSRAEAACWPVARVKETSWTARVQDISASGVCLRVSRRFEPGTVLVVELRGAGEPVRNVILVRVRRVKQESPKLWSVGCSFERLLMDFEVKAWM
jgi:serine/threonine protein kinase